MTEGAANHVVWAVREGLWGGERRGRHMDCGLKRAYISIVELFILNGLVPVV